MLIPITNTKVLFVALVPSILGGIVGCGGNSPSMQPGIEASPGRDPGEVAVESTDLPSAVERRPDEQWTNAEGRSFLGKVPVDVFFDHPHAVASDATPIEGRSRSLSALASQAGDAVQSGGGAPVASEVAAMEEEATIPSAEDATGGWEKILPISVLEVEVTEARNFLAKGLRSVGAYKSSMLSIPPQAAVIAVLAEVAQKHVQSVSWKEDALYVRDLAKRMNESPLQRGKKDQMRLLALFENMTDTLNRSRPAGLEPPPTDDSFADVAEMRFVMMRMAEAERKMKTEAGTEKAFAANVEMVNHEIVMLRAMTHIVTLEGYGYAGDDEFAGYAQAILDASEEIQRASSEKGFAQYEISLSKIGQACNECHSVYKNN